MKIVSDKILKNGTRRVTVDLVENEGLLPIHENSYYKLGYPFGEVVQSHILQDAQQVCWCPLGQEWVS
jgi:hypothetical protein